MNKLIKPIATILLIFGMSTSASAALTAEYTSMGVPTNVNTSFKTYMDWRCITSKSSPQYKYVRRWGWCDENGFMRASGESDLGIGDDYYLIALGSYYGSEIGTKYRITTDTGNVFYGVLADQKADIHTNSTNQYARNKDVVEFLVDTRYLRKDVKRMGSVNVYSPLNGSIAKIEKINFVETERSIEMPTHLSVEQRSKEELSLYKCQAKKVCEDFGYPMAIREKIDKCSTDVQVSVLMRQARWDFWRNRKDI